ncbi:hypothetical protein BH11PLA2_BH11PLA2_05340 [soil metagenome]
MTRSLLLMATVGLMLGTGCLRNQTKKERDPLSPTARATDPATPRKPVASPTSRITNPDDISVVPPRIEEPAMVPVDDRKTLPERIRDRREEKNAPVEKPMLPSPIAPKTVPPTAPAPLTTSPTVPTPPVAAKPVEKPANDLAGIKTLYQTAVTQFDKLVDFEARLVRKEVVKGKDQPAEEVIFQYRKKPFSIYMKTIGEVGRGREVIYVDGQHDGKMHIIMGEGDGNILMKAGSKVAFEPTNPLVTAKSRHKITEAGFGDALTKFGKVITLTENGTRPNGVKPLGKVDRKEYSYPLDGVDIQLNPGDDHTLAKGGRKLVYFDMKEGSASYGFPVLVITLDETGREVEHYCFDKFKNPAKLTDADFDPARLVSKRR